MYGCQGKWPWHGRGSSQSWVVSSHLLTFEGLHRSLTAIRSIQFLQMAGIGLVLRAASGLVGLILCAASKLSAAVTGPAAT